MQRLKLILPKFSGHSDCASKPGTPRKPVLKVFKFGSSVLAQAADLPRVAGEIYRESRHGERIIAVVSAFEGETDALLASCNQAAGQTDCAGIAEAVSLGEEKAAALLRIACDRIGLKAHVVRPEEFGISTTGPLLEAAPIALRHDPGRFFQCANILIVPGFVGIDKSGCRSLLGRGGTDFSAIFIGGELDADVVRLYNDVDGVFDHDPADGSRPLLKFQEVSWNDCLTLARPLLQPRAVEYALARQQRLEVGAIGTADPTHVGTRTSPPDALRARGPLKIALAGYGTVGQALAERLQRESDFEIAAILVRDLTKTRKVVPPMPLTNDLEEFAAAEADVIIDLTSCQATGLKLSQSALTRGIAVISANKLVIGNHLGELEPLGLQNGAKLLYSAAVGGSSPVLEAVRLAFTHGDIARVDAILNGTVNFLLSEIGSGAPYALALQRAQSAGFAEEDPSQDLAGRDAELKLRIIAAQIAGPDARISIHVEALDAGRLAEVAHSKDRWIQHSSLVFMDDRITGAVRICRASEVAALVAPPGERNIATVTGIDGRSWTALGRGAGGAATAEAVTADLYDLWRARSRTGVDQGSIAADPAWRARA